MPEPMTLELVLDVLRMLAAAFPGRMDDRALMRRADVYRDNLQGMSGDALRWAAKIAIQEDSYFPKVARLRALATRWTVANTATVEAQNQRPSGWCDGCQSVARPEKRWGDLRSTIAENPFGIAATGSSWSNSSGSSADVTRLAGTR
jgi:hypothetical protein